MYVRDALIILSLMLLKLNTIQVMSRIYLSVSPEIKTLFSRTNTELDSDMVEIDDVYKVVAKFNDSNPAEECVEIATVLAGTAIVKREPFSRDMSGLSEIELMRLKAEERRYQKSIENIPSLSIKSNGEKSEVKSVSESVAFASHFVLAFGSAFLLGYYLGEYMFEFQKEEYKYIVGGACSFATLILESLLFIIRDQKQTPTSRQAINKRAKSVNNMTVMCDKENESVETNIRKRHR
jgi:hypothetical protein